MQLHQQILSPEQNKLLSFITPYADKFYLVGGTAIALQLGHRESIDFDLFLPNSGVLPQRYMTKQWKNMHFPCIKGHEDDHQQHYIINGVKLTFFAYPYDFPSLMTIDSRHLPMPNLLHLAAMKIHALSRGAKRKDYVDLAFIIREYDIVRVAEYAYDFFGNDISLKNLATQLCYFDDIDYDDVVVYMPGHEREESSLKSYLMEQSKVLFDAI